MTRIIRQAGGHAVGALLCMAALCSGVSAQAAPLYSARLLESAAADPGGEEPVPRNTTARSINDAGQVAGGSAAGSTLWRSAAALGQALVDPRTPEQINGWPGVTAINASGMVVGGGGGRVGGGLIWRDGAGIFVPGFYEARGVNDAGLVVGEGFVDYTPRPAQWIDGSFSLLPMLDDGLYGSANAVNNLGVIAGWREAGGQIVTLWENGVPRSLDIEGVATDINDLGQVAGHRATQGFVWSMGTLLTLDPLAGGLARVSALNDSGLVVGWSDLGDAATTTSWENSQPWTSTACWRQARWARTGGCARPTTSTTWAGSSATRSTCSMARCAASC